MTTVDTVELSLGRIASLACLLELCASKPGNVHRGADFADLTLNDFVVSAELLGQAIDNRKGGKLGRLIHQALSDTSALVGTNTNLGIALLICPMVFAADRGVLNPAGLADVLNLCTPRDAELIYSAIRVARPGSMGVVAEMDIQSAAPSNILQAMSAASTRDLIARQYTNNFQQIFDDVIPLLLAGQQQFDSINETIVFTHVSMLARFGDSLIERKSGAEASRQAQLMACRALEPLLEGAFTEYYTAVGELDFWLRADGNRRNPGTTADLVTAGIFAGIVNGQLSAPFS